MFRVRRQLEGLEQELEGLSSAYDLLRSQVNTLDSDALLLARQDALAAVTAATAEHTRRLAAVTENHHRALNVEAARIVAEARAASGEALQQVERLRRQLEGAIGLRDT